jgi:hypothetical protein
MLYEASGAASQVQSPLHPSPLIPHPSKQGFRLWWAGATSWRSPGVPP